MIEEILLVLFSFMILLHLSWLILYLMPSKKSPVNTDYPRLSIILPAHNEAGVIDASIKRCLDAYYPNEKEVIVVNDGSTDGTEGVVSGIASKDGRVRLINTGHQGKANAINAGIKASSGEIVIVIDADSMIGVNALTQLAAPFSDPRVGAASGVIRADVNGNVLVWYQDLEYLMSSTWRFICNKLNATYLLPGFTSFRKKALEEVGGFATDTLSEDFDIGLRLKKAGYRMVMTNAIMYTHVPQNLKALIRQRLRWSRGTLQVVRKHRDMPFNPEYGAIGFYGIPTQLYWFVHGFVAIPITVYQILYGYMTYFVQYTDYASFNVFKYFFGWFSIYGMLEYSYNTLTGEYPMTWIFILCFLSFILGLAYMILAVVKYTRITWRHLLVMFFYFPYSIFCLAVFTSPILSELNPFRRKKEGVNIWTK